MPPPYAAYLRVYEPLPAFSQAEQHYWRQYLAGDLAVPRAQGARREHQHAQRRMLAGQLPDPGEHAFVTARGEMPFICPWRTSVRAWEAAADFQADMPTVVAEAFLPAAAISSAQANLAQWRAAHPHGRSHIVTSTWAIPVRWFVLFGSEDKLLRIDSGARELVYITDMAKARRRAARALSSLRKGPAETLVADAVEELARWLEGFHPRSLVELDFGGLVWLCEPDQLELEDSVSDVAIALRALAITDETAATAAYERVAERWQRLESLEACN